jgi:transketolase
MVELNPKIGQIDIEQTPTRDGYGQGVLELGEKNQSVVVLTADLAESTRVLEFQKRFPERFVECGVGRASTSFDGW